MHPFSRIQTRELLQAQKNIVTLPLLYYPCNPPSEYATKKSRCKQLSFNDLPQDLVRLIFEHAAVMSSKAAISLTLVSRQVRGWVEPILYHTVVLWTSQSVNLFRVPFNSKPMSFFAHHVRNLFINGKYGMDIILACTNLKRLAAYPLSLIPLPAPRGDSPEHHPSLHSVSQFNAWSRHPCPTEVMLLGYLEDVPWSSPLFNHVRFLYFGIERPTSETAAYIAHLRSLTHCAFPYDGDERSDESLTLTVSMLLESKSLAYLIVLINVEQENCKRDINNSIWKQLASVTDSRLLVGTERCFDGNDWVETVSSKIDIWESWIMEYKNWRYFVGSLCD
ncbi:hypothetical protein Clacol_008840 [Clathrus columnatus]|uniref:F-box domain-containing protein n=1 Tax=Clathrus columnatus TaxID=1419009 RepID=A0AAV5ARQ7_9AGAM|nr:hypothetical protein Clacol_008840 [Clathrus columnatus]